MTFRIEVTWQPGNVTSFDIDFHIYLSEQSSTPPHWQRYRFIWKRHRCHHKRMWLGRCIPTHWYVCNSGYLTYLQIIHLLKRGVYHLWAPQLVRLRSRLDVTNLPLWRRQLLHSIARVLARWWRPLAGRSMATRLDGCTSWRLGSDIRLDAWRLGWVEPSLELTKRCIWCKIRSIK